MNLNERIVKNIIEYRYLHDTLNIINIASAMAFAKLTGTAFPIIL